MASLPRPLIRRPLTITTAVLLAIVLAVVGVVAVPLLYTIDLVSGSPGGRRARAWLLIAATLWTEVIGVAGAGILSIWYLNGRRGPERWLAANYRLEHWWCRRHMKNLGRFAVVSVTLADGSPLEGGRSIMVGNLIYDQFLSARDWPFGASLAFVLIGVMMCLLFRSLRIGLLSMLPNLAPVIFGLGIMGWIDLPLDYYAGFVRPHAYGLSDQALGKWLGDALKGKLGNLGVSSEEEAPAVSVPDGDFRPAGDTAVTKY